MRRSVALPDSACSVAVNCSYFWYARLQGKISPD
jgi:hypothetical protein